MDGAVVVRHVRRASAVPARRRQKEGHAHGASLSTVAPEKPATRRSTSSGGGACSSPGSGRAVGEAHGVDQVL